MDVNVVNYLNVIFLLRILRFDVNRRTIRT